MLSTQAAHLVLWVTLTLFVFANIPQILKNNRLRSTTGLSFYMLYLFHTGALLYLPYSYFLNLPMAFKVLLPLQVTFLSIMVGQSYLYAPTQHYRSRVIRVHSITLLFVLLLTLYGVLVSSYLAGHTAGWIALVCLGSWQVPQMVKMWRSQSTHGYSLYSVVMSFIAALCGVIASIILRLPPQNVLNSGRNVLFRLVQFYQFYRYR